jgi:hypothetical protein
MASMCSVLVGSYMIPAKCKRLSKHAKQQGPRKGIFCFIINMARKM